ncbi:MAG: AAA family ATPase [Flavobacteriia bacterium]|nr:AAA family ATPase [Flavobacteriia bacterium]MBH2023786.1 AAA family ATPase [Flavobacteriales bacterium]
MKISKIKFSNFRIYKGENEIVFETAPSSKNINIIAGKNGFGKTTFLSALIWCFYGKMMVEVEEKHKKDIKNAGGYEKYLATLVNREIKNSFESGDDIQPVVSMEVELTDVAIPSMPCDRVLIRRSYNLSSEIESLEIYIDGLENELTKEVGLELFINDFILPREIAKFFFFDAEKIVTLAEAKSKAELKNLSSAYSEVLGIKKYEDLKKNLETLLVKLRRNGAKPHQKEELQELIDEIAELNELIEINKNKRIAIDTQLITLGSQSEDYQEKLIREGSGITIEELADLRKEQNQLKIDSEEIKGRLKKMIDLVPLVMAGEKLSALEDQLENESFSSTYFNIDISSVSSLKRSIIDKLKDLEISIPKGEEIINVFQQTLVEHTIKNNEDTSVLLDYSPEQIRAVKKIIDEIRNGFNIHFQNIVREEKNNRLASSRVFYKIKQAEARKSNAVAEKLREEKVKIDDEILRLTEKKGGVIEELKRHETYLASKLKRLSELEKNFKLVEADLAKSEVTQNLLDKINTITQRIKEDKKYSLQKSVLLGLKKIMHKSDFVHNVRVNVYDDVMDIVLLDADNRVIDKDSLSKGEQQLYATALLKALVDESGIEFPIFIDSPLQKFDKFHSQNIIQEFYPTVSDQVVLFPLLEKELSEMEYSSLKPFVNKVFIIENTNGASNFNPLKVDHLFNQSKKENGYV